MAKAKKVLICATNYGTWGEELQAPWDIIKEAGHQVTLTTPLGKNPCLY
jgi:putative intracellular protease/amidase